MQKKTIFNAFCLLILSLSASTPLCTAQIPNIAPCVPFQLPLTDKTTATAVLLPTQAGPHYIVYATKTGQIAFFEINPSSTDPTPQPEPPAAIAAIITVSADTAAVLPADVAARLASLGGDYFAYTVAMVADANPPPNSLSWIGRTAGKPYPYTFIVDASGNILWQGPTPSSSDNFLSILHNAKATPSPRVPCASGTCPANRRAR